MVGQQKIIKKLVCESNPWLINLIILEIKAIRLKEPSDDPQLNEDGMCIDEHVKLPVH